MNKVYLLTGATGFIGGALARHFVGLGHPVHCLVFAGRGQDARLQRLDGLIPVVAEGETAEAIRAALGGLRPDVVFNLAAAGVDPAERAPRALLDGNAGQVVRLLEALDNEPLVIHGGSSAEYGPAKAGTLIAEDHPLCHDSCYGAAKASAGLMGHALAAERGIPFVTLRLFHTFGEGEKPGRLVPFLAQRLAAGEEAELSAGGQLRDFIHVEDVARAFVAAADAPGIERGRAYNVCTGTPVSVRQVAERMADLMDRPRSLLRFGARTTHAGEQSWTVGDPARFAAATGWRPRLSLDAGLERAIRAALDGSAPHDIPPQPPRTPS